MWEEQFADLSAVAARQNGLVTTAQAHGVGVDEAALAHLAETGLLQELDWSVHQLPWSTLGPRYAYPYAAWLALSPASFAWDRRGPAGADVVLSHESACNLHGIGSMSNAVMVFTAPEPREEPRSTRVRLGDLGPGDVTTVQGVPVTSAHRTVVDMVTDRTDHGDLRRILMDALAKDLVDVRLIHRALAPLGGRHEFPADGREFLEYFVPELDLSQLSLRNLRGYAVLAFADRVEDVEREVARLLAKADGVPDAGASREIAAEIVGRAAQTGSPG